MLIITLRLFRRLGGKQINNQITLKFLNMIFGHKYNLFGNKILKKYKDILDKSKIYSYIFIHSSFPTGVKYSLKWSQPLSHITTTYKCLNYIYCIFLLNIHNFIFSLIENLDFFLLFVLIMAVSFYINCVTCFKKN